jgi:serine protease DegQ
VTMRARGGVVLVLVALTVGLASGCTGSGASSAGTSSSGSGSSSSSTTAVGGASGSPAAGGLEQVPGVVAKLEPSVVPVPAGGGVGSGVVYTADGPMLSNEHVVRGNRTVRLAFPDGQQVSGVVKASHVVADLALVHAERRGLPPATFQTRLPQVGSLAVVIGSPLGDTLRLTVRTPARADRTVDLTVADSPPRGVS